MLERATNRGTTGGVALSGALPGARTLTSNRVAPRLLTTLPVLPSISSPSSPSCRSGASQAAREEGPRRWRRAAGVRVVAAPACGAPCPGSWFMEGLAAARERRLWRLASCYWCAPWASSLAGPTACPDAGSDRATPPPPHAQGRRRTSQVLWQLVSAQVVDVFRVVVRQRQVLVEPQLRRAYAAVVQDVAAAAVAATAACCRRCMCGAACASPVRSTSRRTRAER